LLTGSGDVNCVVALPPYMQQKLANPNIHVVANSFDLACGPTTFTVAYTSRRFHDRDPKLYQAVYQALTEATERVRTDIRTASRY
jgi:NitT/TauT family transport system substrate-binding protein